MVLVGDRNIDLLLCGKHWVQLTTGDFDNGRFAELLYRLVSRPDGFPSRRSGRVIMRG
jgi:hypothetical protein